MAAQALLENAPSFVLTSHADDMALILRVISRGIVRETKPFYGMGYVVTKLTLYVTVVAKTTVDKGITSVVALEMVPYVAVTPNMVP